MSSRCGWEGDTAVTDQREADLLAAHNLRTAVHGQWRVGSHYGVHLYAVTDTGSDDIPIGTMFTPELATDVVAAHNASLGQPGGADE